MRIRMPRSARGLTDGHLLVMLIFHYKLYHFRNACTIGIHNRPEGLATFMGQSDAGLTSDFCFESVDRTKALLNALHAEE